MKEWIRETHGPYVELLRHFLLRFFDSELLTDRDYMTGVLIGAFPVFIQWFLLFAMPLHQKYERLSRLTSPGPYRAAVRADELWLIALVMSTIGLLTAMKWPALFPDVRDYRALGTLPLRPRQIFGAKLMALLLIATATLVTINILPSFSFPALSGSRWAIHASFGARVWAHAGASLAASSFFLFGLIATQGILMSLLPRRTFGWVAVNLQGFLVAVMLVLIIVSFSIQPQITKVVLQPEWARWLPPVWFLGLYQVLSGDPEPAMHVLAYRAEIALAIAIALTLLTYFLNYQRHRTLLVEGVTGPKREHRLGSALLGWLVPNPRQQAVLAFMMKTLTRSSYHRMIMIVYGGLGFAAAMAGLSGVGSVVDRSRILTAGFVYFHLIVLLLLLVAARHLFSLPAELKANWIFQITEGEGRGMWLPAVDLFVLFWGSLLLLVIPFPLEIRLLGGRGVAEAMLFLVLGLLSYEWYFSSWEKMPFTCSHLPGKAPIWMVLAFFGLFAVVSLLNALLLLILYNPVAFVVILAIMLTVWTRMHRMRRRGWTELRLKFEELPEPAVRSLNLLN